MKLAYLTGIRLAAGGAPAIHVSEICRGLAALGHEVTLFSADGAGVPGCRARALPGWLFRLSFLRFHRVRTWLFWRFSAWKLARERWDAVYCRYELGQAPIADVARRRRIPWIAEINGTPAQYRDWGYSESFVARSEAEWAAELARADAVITQGSGIASYLVEHLRLSSQRVHVVDNGVDPELFHPRPRAEVRRQLGVPAERLVMGYLGSYQVYHDLEVILQAMKQLVPEMPELLFLCVGSGARREAIVRRADELGLGGAVAFRDHVDQPTAAAYINAFDLCLITVPARYLGEARPFKIREYLACGRPVIATAGEAADPLSQMALPVPPEDPSALAVRIREWVARRDAFEVEAERWAGKIAEHYSWLAAARKTAEIIDRARVSSSSASTGEGVEQRTLNYRGHP